MGPSPFEIGRAIGTNIGGAQRHASDTSALDEILYNANRTQDHNAINDAMTQILQRVSPEKQQMAIGVLQQKQKMIQDRIQQEKALQQSQTQIGALAKARGLDPKDLAGFGSNTKLAEQATRPQKSAGGLTGQAVPPEISEKMEQIVKENEDKDPIELALAFNKAGVPLIYSNPIVESKRRQVETKDKNLLEDKIRTIKFGQEIGREVLKKADALAETLPQKKSALRLMGDAIASKNLGFFSRDHLAEVTGVEGLRSSEGAIFKTAGKEYFLGNIQRAGARPNQWIEQQISDMLPKIGRSTEANLSVKRALENELALDNERIKVTSEIADEIASGDGDFRKLGTKVEERLSKFAEEKQELLYNDLRAIKSIEQEEPEKFHKVTPGSYVSDYVIQALLITFNNDWPKAKEEAKKLGYKVDE